MCVKCARNIIHVPEMCPVETCQANGSSPFNVPDMFLPVSVEQDVIYQCSLYMYSVANTITRHAGLSLTLSI